MIRFDTIPLTGSTIQGFIDRAVEIGQNTIIYCDLSYFLSFYKAFLLGQQKNIKVLPAVSLFVNTNPISTVNLLAKNQSGLSDLFLFLSQHERSGEKYIYHGQEYPVFPLDSIINFVNNNDNIILILSSEPRSILSVHYNYIVNNATIHHWLLTQKAFLMLIAQTIKNAIKQFTEITFENGKRFVFPSNYKAAFDVNKRAPLGMLNEGQDYPKKILYITPTIGKYISMSNNGAVTQIRNHEVYLPLFTDGSCYQTYLNKKALDFAKTIGIKPLVWYLAYYAKKEDKVVQDVRFSSENKAMSFVAHMRSYDEIKDYLVQNLGFTESEAQEFILHTDTTLNALGHDFDLKYETRLVDFGSSEEVWRYIAGLIKKYDRIPKDKKLAEQYIARLKYEVDVLSKNGKIDLLPYFMPISQVLDYYYENGQLTGPGRGSAAGSLLLYLIGITHVDPIKYGLSFERFLSLARIKNNDMPDVDVDLSDRTLLVGDEDGNIEGFLWKTYGDRAAQISTRTLLRLKSSIKDVNRFFHGRVLPEIEELTKKLPSAPQGISDTDFVFGYEDADGNKIEGLINTSPELQGYIKTYPQEWEVVKKMLGVSRQYSKHASAFVISNEPVYKNVPVFLNGRVTQYEAKEVEKAGLIKYDFLVVNQLKDIHACLQKIAQKHQAKLPTGHFIDVDGTVRFIWDLPEKEEVFRSVWGGDTTSLFQINTDTMRSYVVKMKPKSIEDLALLLALVRPGPMDYVDPKTNRTMADEYLIRRFDLESTKDNIIKPLFDLLPETYGVMVYQEQNTKVAREIGKMSPEDAEELRRAFAKKQLKKALSLKPLFMEGATKTVGPELAEVIWEQMETSARYSFNKSHAVSYAFITYATMYLRHYFPLEWWASVLENTDEHEFTTKLYPAIKHLIAPPTVNATTSGVFIDYKNNKIRMRLSLLKTIGEKSVQTIVDNAPYKNLFDFVKRAKIGKSLTRKFLIAGVLDELFDEEVYNKMKELFGDSFVGFNSFQVKMKAVVLAYLLANKSEVKKEQIVLSEEDLAVDDLELFLLKKSIYPTSQDDFLDLVKKRLSNLSKNRHNLASTFERPIKSIFYHKAVVQYLSDYSGVISSDHAKSKISYIERGELVQDAPLDRKYLVPGFVIDHKWFHYKGKDGRQKTALKIQVDFGSDIQEEVVVWPPYDKDSAESLLYQNQEHKKKIDNGSLIVLLYELGKNRVYLNLVIPL